MHLVHKSELLPYYTIFSRIGDGHISRPLFSRFFFKQCLVLKTSDAQVQQTEPNLG